MAEKQQGPSTTRPGPGLDTAPDLNTTLSDSTLANQNRDQLVTSEFKSNQELAPAWIRDTNTRLIVGSCENWLNEISSAGPRASEALHKFCTTFNVPSTGDDAAEFRQAQIYFNEFKEDLFAQSIRPPPPSIGTKEEKLETNKKMRALYEEKAELYGKMRAHSNFGNSKEHNELQTRRVIRDEIKSVDKDLKIISQSSRASTSSNEEISYGEQSGSLHPQAGTRQRDVRLTWEKVKQLDLSALPGPETDRAALRQFEKSPGSFISTYGTIEERAKYFETDPKLKEGKEAVDATTKLENERSEEFKKAYELFELGNKPGPNQAWAVTEFADHVPERLKKEVMREFTAPKRPPPPPKAAAPFKSSRVEQVQEVEQQVALLTDPESQESAAANLLSLPADFRERAVRIVEGNLKNSSTIPETERASLNELRENLLDSHTAALAIYRDLRAVAKAEGLGIGGAELQQRRKEVSDRMNQLSDSKYGEITQLIEDAIAQSDIRGLDELGKSILLSMRTDFSPNPEPDFTMAA